MPRRLLKFDMMATDLDTLFTAHKINPHIRCVLLTLVAPYYWGTELEFDLPDEYQDLIQFQQALHADSVFMGCFSTEWLRLQEAHLRLNHLPRATGQAALGLCMITTYLLDIVHSVWLQRNTALHGDDSTTKLLSYKHTQLLLEIQDLYDQESSMLAADRKLFVHPYEYWLSQPTTQLQTFLRRMRLTVKTSITQAADMGSNFRTINTYSPPPFPMRSLTLLSLAPLTSHRNPISYPSWRDLDPSATAKPM
jgi:hypothetical protein